MRDITKLQYKEMTESEKAEFMKGLEQLQSELKKDLQKTIVELSRVNYTILENKIN